MQIAGDAAKTRNLGNIYIRLKPIERRDRDQFMVMTAIRGQVLPPFAGNLRTSVQPIANIGGTLGMRGWKPSRRGTPVSSTRLVRSRASVPGSVVQTTAAPRAKKRVARPGRTSFSCKTYGILLNRAAATAGAIT